MSNKTKGNNFLIGLFIISTIILGIGIIIWLGADKMDKESKTYVTYFDSSIDGLDVGSAVKYQGVACGSVSAINIAEDGKLVEVKMSILPSIKINKMLRIQATFSGIAGGKFLQLYYPKERRIMMEHPYLNFIPEYDVIESSPSEIEGLANAATDIASKLTKVEFVGISERLYQLIDTLAILASYSSKLVRGEQTANAMLNLEKASFELASVIAKIDSLRIYDDLEYTSLNLRKTSDEVYGLSKSIDKKVSEINIPQFMDKVYNKFDTTTSVMNGTISTIERQSSSTFLSLLELIEDLKVTNRDLRKSLNAISDDPSRVLFTEPPKKEK